MTIGLKAGYGKLRQAGMKMLGTLVFVAAPLGLISCGGGSGTTYDPFVPTRIVSLGDGITDITPGARYTVNASDGQTMTAIEQVVASFGLSLTNTAVFTSTAIGNARIAKTASFTVSPVRTLKNQVANYLGTNSVADKDMFVLSGGITDIIEEYKAYMDAGAGGAANTLMTNNLDQAALQYVAIVQTLIDAGAKRIVVIPPYSLFYTPWAKGQLDSGNKLKEVSRAFNDKLLSELSSKDGRIVIYAPMEGSFEQVILYPGSYGLSDVSNPICTSVDANNGIGIGTGQVNSSKCTQATLLGGATLEAYAFADKIYPTPAVNRYLGTFIYNSAANR